LFSGFSFISFVEIVYVFGVKFCCAKIPEVKVIRKNNRVATETTEREEKTVLSSIKAYILLYMRKSSIHSFNFIGSEQRKLEK
jgi:hypothetical protein